MGQQDVKYSMRKLRKSFPWQLPEQSQSNRSSCNCIQKCANRLLTHWSKQKWCCRERTPLALLASAKCQRTRSRWHISTEQTRTNGVSHAHTRNAVSPSMWSLFNTSPISNIVRGIFFLFHFCCCCSTYTQLLHTVFFAVEVVSTTVSHTVLANWRWSATRTDYKV